MSLLSIVTIGTAAKTPLPKRTNCHITNAFLTMTTFHRAIKIISSKSMTTEPKETKAVLIFLSLTKFTVLKIKAANAGMNQ